jgi:hypothetical protein
MLAGPINFAPLPSETKQATPRSATTLEWLLASTPASHVFTQLPVIRSV